MISEFELVVVAHAGIAKLAQRYYDFDIHDLPVKPDMPPFGIFWHERTHRSQQHRWFREQVFESVSLFQ